MMLETSKLGDGFAGGLTEVELDVAAPRAGAVGRVISVDDSGGPAVGARIVVLPVAGCSHCERCRGGMDNWCRDPVHLAMYRIETTETTWGRRMSVDHRLLVPVRETLDPRLAASLPSVADILRAVRHCGSVDSSGAIIAFADPDSFAIASAIADQCGLDLVQPDAAGIEPAAVALHLSTEVGTLGRAIRSVGHLGVVVTTGSYPSDQADIPDYYREMIVKEGTVRGSGRASRADIAATLAILTRVGVPGPAIEFLEFTTAR